MRKDNFRSLTLAVVTIVFFLLICITNIFHFCDRLNADLASDAVLGKLIWDTKEAVPHSWYTASEARIICTPNIAALFYGLTGNMVLSAGLACCAMTLLIIGSVCCFGKILKWKPDEIFLFALLSMLLPNHLVVLELLYLFASYYAIHVVIFFLTVGCYLKFIDKGNADGKAVFISMIPAFILGVQGVRGILIIYAPLFGMEIIRNIYVLYCTKNVNKKNIWIGAWTIMLLAISFCGTLVPVSVGQGVSRNIRKGLSKLWTVVIPDMKKTIGYDFTNIPGKICLIFLLLLALALLLEIMLKMIKKQEIALSEWGYMTVCCTVAVSAIMVAFTTIESTERYYFMLMFMMAYALVLKFIKWKETKKEYLCVIVVLAVVINAWFVYKPILCNANERTSERYQVGLYLEENNYTMAYATFENANTTTVLTNGKVTVAAVASLEKMDICKWMSSTKWYVPNVPAENKTAYIVEESEQDAFLTFLNKHENEVCFETQIGRFLIYSSNYNFSNLGDE